MLAIAGIVFFLSPTAKWLWHAKRHMQKKKMFTTESPEEYTAEFFYPCTSTHQADVKVKGAVYLVNLSTPKSEAKRS